MKFASIAEFVQNLDDSKIFTDSSLSSVSQTRVDTGIGFTFSIEAHYNADEAAGIAAKQAETEASGDGEGS